MTLDMQIHSADAEGNLSEEVQPLFKPQFPPVAPQAVEEERRWFKAMGYPSALGEPQHDHFASDVWTLSSSLYPDWITSYLDSKFRSG